MTTTHGTLTWDSTGAFGFVPDPPPAPPPPPPVAPPPPISPPPTASFVLGQPPFAATSLWNRPVPSNARYTTLAWPKTTGYNYNVAWDSYSPGIYVASPTDPLVKVSYPAGWGRPAGVASVHIPAGVSGANGTDGDIVIIDGTAVYNFWQFNRTSDTSATAASFGVCDAVRDSGFGSSSPYLGAGTTAIGSSLLGGLIVQAETDAGPIQHAIALRLGIPLVKQGFVAPAIASDSGMATGIVQEGDLLAIPPGTAMPAGLSVLGQKVFIAMLDYGAYVVDRTNNDATGGTNGPRAQANAYDAASMTALWHDMDKIVPLLKRVS